MCNPAMIASCCPCGQARCYGSEMRFTHSFPGHVVRGKGERWIVLAVTGNISPVMSLAGHWLCINLRQTPS